MSFLKAIDASPFSADQILDMEDGPYKNALIKYGFVDEIDYEIKEINRSIREAENHVKTDSRNSPDRANKMKVRNVSVSKETQAEMKRIEEKYRIEEITK